jgi:pyruvate/2-oxoglutarate dehydrogenase complex dihydrolipoamide acyltransferase (E2) component
MGDSISSGVIEAFVKNPGDFVEADMIIARIETDKVTVDITAPKAGVIEKYFAGIGDTVDVGADFYSLNTDAKGSSSTPAAPKQAATAAAPTPAAPPKQVSIPT